MKNVFRWIIFLPAAIIGSILVQWFLVISHSRFAGWFIADFAIKIAGFFIAGYSLVAIGTYIAPKYKLSIGFGLTGLVLIFTGVMIITYCVLKEYGEIFYYFLMIIGAGSYTYDIYKKGKNEI
ncbi:MAG: hypothetical protein ACE5HX_19675 [bacterium]